MQYAYPAVFTKEDNGAYSVAFSDIEGCYTSGESDTVSLVCCDTLAYRKLYSNKAVKKTLSIPAWLNTMAERADLNFSNVLQEALKLRLDIQ